MSRLNIRNIINKLFKKYKTKDVFELASYLNIKIKYWDLDESVKGLYKYEKRNKFIVLNSALSDFEKRWVLAHELGHAVLHKNVECAFLCNHAFFAINKFEREADIFAAEILLPDDINKYKDYTMKEIASIEQVPVEFVQLKYAH